MFLCPIIPIILRDMDDRMSATYRDALRAALLYLLLSVLWVSLSGFALNSFFDDSAEALHWQTINGYIWLLLSAGIIFIARTRLFRCLGIGAQLAERSADRERLRQAAAVFDCTREGVLVTNEKGLIVHVNRAFMQITGYQREEVMGQQPSLFKSGRHPASFYQAMFKTLNSVGEWSGEIWNRRKAGKSIRNGRRSVSFVTMMDGSANTWRYSPTSAQSRIPRMC